MVKFQAGDKIIHMDRDRALMRKLFDMALNGKVPAIQLLIARLAQAQAALSVKADPEAPIDRRGDRASRDDAEDVGELTHVRQRRPISLSAA